jgi:hypothetical protein
LPLIGLSHGKISDIKIDIATQVYKGSTSKNHTIATAAHADTQPKRLHPCDLDYSMRSTVRNTIYKSKAGLFCYDGFYR